MTKTMELWKRSLRLPLRSVLIDDSFPDYPSLGTGVLMFDSFREGGGQHGGRLSDKVIEFKVP